MSSVGAKVAPLRRDLTRRRSHERGAIPPHASLPTIRELSDRWHQRNAFQPPVARLPVCAVPLAVLACVGAPLATGLNAPTGLRLAAVLGFMCTAPGVAFLAIAGGRGELGLIVGISLGVVALVAQAMLSLGHWRPEAGLYALAAACLLALTASGFGGFRMPTLSARRLVGIRNLRRWFARVRRTAGVHVLVLPMAVGAWAIGIAGTRLGRMGGIGLLQAVSPTYFVAFFLVLAGFALAAARERPDPRLLAAYVVTLIVIVHATTALLYDEPRYAWTYKHFGVINLIAASGHADRQIDIYNNWPAFFGANAWLSTTTGLAPLEYSPWAQLFFNLFNVAAVRFAVGSLTGDEGMAWTVAFFFVLGNWVGQDYLAPQAFGFALSLVVIGLCLRHRGNDRAAVGQRREVRSHSRSGHLDHLASVRVMAFRDGTARVALTASRPAVGARARARIAASGALNRARMLRGRSHRVIDGRRPAPLGSPAALVAGGICFVAVVVSHQLSPLLLIVQVTTLALLVRAVPLRISAAMIMIETWWVSLAWPFVGVHFALLDPGGAAVAAPGRNLANALPGARLSFYAPLAVTMCMAALAVVGLIRRGRTDRMGLVPASLVVVPVVAVTFQSYGGEGPYRAYLFALPWLAFLAAFSCVRASSRSGRWRLHPARLFIAATLVGTCLLFAYFGQELSNHIPRDDVRAATWYEEHAPAGSLRINLAPAAPDRLTARYPLVSLADPPTLLERRGFTGHRLGSADIPRLERYIAQQGHHRAYVILTIGQENYGRLNGLLPAGSVQSLATALERTPSFRLVYMLSTAWIFEYRPTRPRAVSSHPTEVVYQ